VPDEDRKIKKKSKWPAAPSSLTDAPLIAKLIRDKSSQQCSRGPVERIVDVCVGQRPIALAGLEKNWVLTPRGGGIGDQLRKKLFREDNTEDPPRPRVTLANPAVDVGP